MKTFTPTLLVLACALALSACNKQENPEETGNATAPTTAAPTPAMPAPTQSQSNPSTMAPESSHQPAAESSVKPPDDKQK
jgi:hypothetical protein